MAYIVMKTLHRMSVCKCMFCIAAWLLGCYATWYGMRVTLYYTEECGGVACMGNELL